MLVYREVRTSVSIMEPTFCWLEEKLSKWWYRKNFCLFSFRIDGSVLLLFQRIVSRMKVPLKCKHSDHSLRAA